MVDTVARARVRSAVEDYLSDKVSAFQFDELLWQIETADETVRFVISQLWYIYDDVQDHLVHADKRTWDIVQRLLLLLDSGDEIVFATHRHWHASQAVALLTLAWMGIAVWQCPPAWILPVIVGWLAAMLLMTWRTAALAALDAIAPWQCWPFPSLNALRRAWEGTPGFRKQRHRPEVAQRRVRDSSWDRAIGWNSKFGLLFVSPALLLFQLLPLRNRVIHLASECVADGASNSGFESAIIQ